MSFFRLAHCTLYVLCSEPEDNAAADVQLTTSGGAAGLRGGISGSGGGGGDAAGDGAQGGEDGIPALVSLLQRVHGTAPPVTVTETQITYTGTGGSRLIRKK